MRWFKIVGMGLLAAYLLFASWWVVSSGFSRSEFLLNVACDPTRELWRDLNREFIAEYERTHGVKLVIRQSHAGSGSQARAVIDGLQADVVTLALFSDTDQIRKAGLIEDDWIDKLPHRSLPYTSTIVFVVRRGNPKMIRDWPDLIRPGVESITPDPKTSGNGKWAFLAMWGSIRQRGGTEAEAEEYVKRAYMQVPIRDASARAASLTFAQKKKGDVHLTWENEAHLEVAEAGGELEIVYPPLSVLAEPHVAVVDRVVDIKQNRAAAEAYLKFLYTDVGQEIIAKHYHRPINPEVLKKHASTFPPLTLFRALELEPSWPAIQTKFFADGALFDQILARGRAK